MADIEKVEFEFPDEIEEKEQSNQTVDSGADNDESEIEVVDDTPEEDRDREPMKEPPEEVTDEELAKYDEGVQKRIKRFTKGYHDERRAKEAALREREAAVQYAQQLMAENEKLKGTYTQTQTALIAQAKKVAENEVLQAKKAYKDAYDSGDSDALVEAQSALNTAQAKLERVSKFKPQTLQQPKTEVQPQPQRVESPQPAQQQQVVDPDLAEWQERNPWFGQDKKLTAYALGLHDEITSDGIQAGSKEYYKRIDSDLRKNFPAKFGAEESAEAPKSQRTKSNVVAPATRSTAPKKIVLTQSQVAIAKRLGLTNEQYARAVAEEMRKM
jgi:hypothetical protein